MLALDDPRWSELTGGYQIPYDVSPALRRLEQGDDVWEELAQELHHNGDIGDAAYAAVPHLVRVGKSLESRPKKFYNLLSTLEVQRHRVGNPPLPDWLAESYAQALRELLLLACSDLAIVEDRDTIRSILGAIAVAKADHKLGILISHSDDSSINATLEEFDAWSEIMLLTSKDAEAQDQPALPPEEQLPEAAGPAAQDQPPPPLTTQEYVDHLKSTVSAPAWLAICRRAVDDAQAGDSNARQWLSNLLLGPSIEGCNGR